MTPENSGRRLFMQLSVGKKGRKQIPWDIVKLDGSINQDKKEVKHALIKTRRR